MMDAVPSNSSYVKPERAVVAKRRKLEMCNQIMQESNCLPSNNLITSRLIRSAIHESEPSTSESEITDCSKSRKPCFLTAQSKEIVANMLHFLEKEADAKCYIIPVRNLLDRVTVATGLDRSSIKNLTEQIGENEENNVLWRENFPHIAPELAPGYVKGMLRHWYIDHVLLKSAFPTIQDLKNKHTERTYQDIPLTQFRKTLGELGFENRTLNSGRVILLEKHRVRMERIKYLRKILRCREDKKEIVHVGVFEKPIIAGYKLVIIQACSQTAFLSNKTAILKSNFKDFYNEMSQKYIPQFMDQLIPKLPPNCLIVLDSYSFFKKCEDNVTSNSKKIDMETWLRERNIPFNASNTKTDLYRLIKQYHPKYKQYTIDKKFIENDFEVLRFPPHNPDLNPLELIYYKLNLHLLSINSPKKLEEVYQQCEIWYNMTGRITDWKRCCRQICEWEQKYVLKENRLDEVIDSILINIEDEEESDYNNSSDLQNSSDEEDKNIMFVKL